MPLHGGLRSYYTHCTFAAYLYTNTYTSVNVYVCIRDTKNGKRKKNVQTQADFTTASGLY